MRQRMWRMNRTTTKIMTNAEKINLILRYVYFTDDYMHSQYINACNAFLINSKSDEADVLKLFKAKVRAEAFADFCKDLYRILYYR